MIKNLDYTFNKFILKTNTLRPTSNLHISLLDLFDR